MGNLLSDPNQLQKIKGDIQKTLFSKKRPDSVGYDADAFVLGDVYESVSQKDVEDSQTRGRNKFQSQDAGSADWPQRSILSSALLAS
jgi:hypothetical protein